MQQSTETAELYAALAAAQAEITNPSKDKIAKVPTKTGGSYSYSYADIADVLNTVRPVLARHGLAVMQLPVMAAGDLLLRTISYSRLLGLEEARDQSGRSGPHHGRCAVARHP